MFNLKSIYFYFLAIQISLIKFIKKIYFSTNFYNKSLISKTPQQFYFHPNPFLLSLITDYKKNSFRISEIDPNIFWIKKKNEREEKEVHSFLWLNLIDRKNDGRSLPLSPLMYGGGQEKGIRPGTLPVHLIAGMAHACNKSYLESEKWQNGCKEIKSIAIDSFKNLDYKIYGKEQNTLPNTLSISL